MPEKCSVECIKNIKLTVRYVVRVMRSTIVMLLRAASPGRILDLVAPVLGRA